MGKLYGYKRWYEIEHENNGKKGSFKRKIRVKRFYNEGSNSYEIKRNENGDTTEIENKEFIEKFKKYKIQNNYIEKFYVKFNVGNILFKLKVLAEKKGGYFEKVENVLSNIEILEQTKQLAKNRKISRKEIERELLKPNRNEEIKVITIKDITIYLQQGEEFKKDTKINAIRYRKLNALKVKKTMRVWQKLLTEDLMNMKKQKSLLDLAESLI